MRTVNPAVSALALAGAVLAASVAGGIEGAAASGGCGRPAARAAVEKIEDGFTLASARQAKAPLGRVKSYGAWLIAGRVVGGAADGKLGMWARIKLRPQATGVSVAIDAWAQTATPSLGADLHVFRYLESASDKYESFIACMAEH